MWTYRFKEELLSPEEREDRLPDRDRKAMLRITSNNRKYPRGIFDGKEWKATEREGE